MAWEINLLLLHLPRKRLKKKKKRNVVESRKQVTMRHQSRPNSNLQIASPLMATKNEHTECISAKATQIHFNFTHSALPLGLLLYLCAMHYLARSHVGGTSQTKRAPNDDYAEDDISTVVVVVSWSQKRRRGATNENSHQ